MKRREYEEWMYLLKLIKAQKVHFLYTLIIITPVISENKTGSIRIIKSIYVGIIKLLTFF